MSSRRDVEARFECSDFDRDLQVVRVRGRERISGPFEFDVEVVCAEPGPQTLTELLEAEGTLSFVRDGEAVRQVHGVVRAVEEDFDFESSHARARLRLAPRLDRLDLVRQQEIYLDASVPDLLAAKLQMVGLATPGDFDFGRLLGSYPKREFVVQFDESDLAFVQRIAEHVGVSYFFDHEGGRDRIVFCDHGAAYERDPRLEVLALRRRGDDLGVRHLAARARSIPSFYVVMDYNYRTPAVELRGERKSDAGAAGGIIAWGDHFKTPEEGAALAAIRAEERECRQLCFEGESDLPELRTGYRYRVEGHTRLDGRELLVVEVAHELTQAHAVAAGIDAVAYHNRFVATPAERTFRPARVTPKPTIPGLLTGVIEAASPGDTSDHPRIDDEGRYTVRFVFDTAAPGERKASHPVRLAQPMGGTAYGMHFPLRPGVEVVLAFVNGDPDRPIVVGAVHNPHTPAHVTAPNATTNTIRTASGIRMEFKDG